jgi:UDP-GlcNAc:undecaprenyl-phosphate/decaprenyl-phosphate GlcNAc-1-phosphate transferase
VSANAVLGMGTVGTAALVVLLCTPLIRALARRLGIVTRPSADRWHKHPTALLGGVAIVIATCAGLVAATLIFGEGSGVWSKVVKTPPAIGLVLSTALMFIVGLVDDLVRMRAPTKFLFQLLAGAILLSCGAVFPVTPWLVVNVVVTLFWFVAVTNAFNLLDGLDGVAAGVGGIAAFFLGLTYANQGGWLHTSLAWSLAGAMVGFLWYNFHPASIFMGDAGSLFIGSVLAGLVVASPSPASASLVSVLFVPLAIVAVPLLDTSLVTVTRLLAGRPISQGGLDHSTYRLIALGLSESQVALLLYGFAGIGGGVAIFLVRLDRGLGLLLGTAFLIGMSLLAAYLGRMRVESPKVQRTKTVTLLVRNLVYKRRLVGILLDVALITLAYYGAYRLRFDDVLPPNYAESFRTTIGLVIAVKIAMLWFFGVYRGAWEYVGIVDLYRIVGAIVVGGMALFIYGEWRVPVLAASHSIVYIDALLLAALILSSRLSFRSLETVRKWLQPKGERVLIYGAGRLGELTVRELVNNPERKFHPVCFLDDDDSKHGAQIHGVPIFGGIEALPTAVDRYNVNKIVIGTRKLPPNAFLAIRTIAEALNLDVAEVGFGVRWIPSRANGELRVEVPASVEVRSA